MMDVTLYRAADEPGALPGAHFTDNKEDAEAYLDDPGFGGARLFEFRVRIAEDAVLDTTGRSVQDAFAELAAAAGYVDPEERAQAWRDDGFYTVFHVLENRAKEERALAEAGFQWVVYNDDYPEDAITWKYLRGPLLLPTAEFEVS